MRRSDIPIVVAASLVFADATIVTLALPNLLVDLHTTVYGVAAGLAVYTAVLGCTALLARRLLPPSRYGWTGAGALAIFSLACIVCALADRLAVRVALAAIAGACAVIGAQALADPFAAPRAVAIADPCRSRKPPHTGGLGGAVQVIA
jgi:MFS family permease